MLIPFKMLLTRQSDGVEEVCAGAITDADWALLCTFRDYAKDLESAEWVRSGLDADYSVGPDENGATKVDVPNKPSDAAVRELLHLMRPFLLRNERTWYPAINSKLRGYLDHPYLRQWLALGRRIFDNGHFQLYGQISINELPLHDERTFGLWLNAFEYHRDPQKRAQLSEAMHGPPDEFVLAVFRSILADRATEVPRLATLITSLEAAPSNQRLKGTSSPEVI